MPLSWPLDFERFQPFLYLKDCLVLLDRLRNRLRLPRFFRRRRVFRRRRRRGVHLGLIHGVKVYVERHRHFIRQNVPIILGRQFRQLRKTLRSRVGAVLVRIGHAHLHPVLIGLARLGGHVEYADQAVFGQGERLVLFEKACAVAAGGALGALTRTTAKGRRNITAGANRPWQTDWRTALSPLPSCRRQEATAAPRSRRPCRDRRR